jgi:hypothetical protein
VCVCVLFGVCVCVRCELFVDILKQLKSIVLFTLPFLYVMWAWVDILIKTKMGERWGLSGGGGWGAGMGFY